MWRAPPRREGLRRRPEPSRVLCSRDGARERGGEVESPMRADAYEQELGIFLETLARTAHCGTAASGAQVYYAAHRRLAVL